MAQHARPGITDHGVHDNDSPAGKLQCLYLCRGHTGLQRGLWFVSEALLPTAKSEGLHSGLVGHSTAKYRLQRHLPRNAWGSKTQPEVAHPFRKKSFPGELLFIPQYPAQMIPCRYSFASTPDRKRRPCSGVPQPLPHNLGPSPAAVSPPGAHTISE